MTPALLDAARSATRCLKVSRDDDVLIVCNPTTRSIAEALLHASLDVGCSAELLEFEAQSRSGAEPPGAIAAAMCRATVVFAPTVYSLSHTAARAAATDAGVRIATMVGLDTDVFCRALAVDYDLLKRDGGRLAARLTAASTCRVRSAAGTDLFLQLAGRLAISDDGDLGSPGEWGNLPAGEAYIAPIESDAEGSIVFDGSLADFGLLRDSVQVEVREGRITEAHGQAGQWLTETLDAGGPRGRYVAELGVGTNPSAIVSGNTAEDEKAIGTAHVAFGTSVSFGGSNEAGVHIDGVLRAPDIDLDGEPFLRRGRPVD
jgi:leucyl aminopeptidase (aminopeptidase T)